jgi:hypothetical protein
VWSGDLNSHAIAYIKTQTGEVTESDPDYAPVEAEHLILDADASQSFVVNAALAGHNLVVQGPPGTGKSQTIANVIACLVAEGQSVLFVAQKRAAITAVLDRLEGAGLGDLALDLFAAGASRRYVAEQIRGVLERQMSIGAPITDSLDRSLTSARDRLVEYKDALHSRQWGWGATVTDLLSLSYALPSVAQTTLRLPLATLDAWSPGMLDDCAEKLTELANLRGLDRDRLSRAGWNPQVITSSDSVVAANALLVSLRAEQVPLAESALNDCWTELSLVPPRTIEEAHQTLTLLAMNHYLSSRFTPDALDSNTTGDQVLTRMLASLDKGFRKSAGISLGWREGRSLRKQALALAQPQVTGTTADSLKQDLVRLRSAQYQWRAVGGTGQLRAGTRWEQAGKLLGSVIESIRQLAPMLQGVALPEVPINELPGALAELDRDHSRASMPRAFEIEQELNAAGCGSFLAVLRSDPSVVPAGVKAGDILRRAAIHSLLEQAWTTSPGLAGVSGDDLKVATNQFQQLDLEHLEANAAKVRRAAAVRLTNTLDTYDDCWRHDYLTM